MALNHNDRLRVRLDRFSPKQGLVRGRPIWVEAAWYLTKCIFFLSPFPWPSFLKRWLLRCYGAKVGRGLVLRPRSNIHFPWKLEIGEHCWIGQECEILNLEPVHLGNHVVLSHRVYLATGNHDYKDHTMPYRNAPIRVDDGAWLASCSFVGAGVHIGEHAVVTAGSVVNRSVAPWTIVQGNPARFVRERVLER